MVFFLRNGHSHLKLMAMKTNHPRLKDEGFNHPREGH